jgi:hypothetical protein
VTRRKGYIVRAGRTQRTGRCTAQGAIRYALPCGTIA